MRNTIMYKGPQRKFDKRTERTRKMSEYALQFIEKQRLKALYGLREKDLKNYYLKAKKLKRPTEEVLATLLESRLDNVIYRLGWAKTRTQARQIVNHGHIYVNGRKVNIPSRQMNAKETIEIKPRSQSLPLFSNLKEILAKHKPPIWIKRNDDFVKAEILSRPVMSDFTESADIKLIVEFYSR